jgi:hypothetical protein
MKFDANTWGPHYWFFLHTIAEFYPLTPNEVTIKKHYELITNMPLFIPDEQMGNKFSEILDKYPVSPYLDNRDSFVRWMHFIHNKYNHMLGKEEVSLAKSLDMYREQYKPQKVSFMDNIRLKSRYIHFAFIIVLIMMIYLYYSD